MGVKQLLAEMLQMPLLGSSIFAITSQATAKAENDQKMCRAMPLAMLGFQRLNSTFLQVWRRYINEVAKMELVDTTRVGGVDVTRQRKLIKHGDSILFEFKD